MENDKPVVQDTLGDGEGVEKKIEMCMIEMGYGTIRRTIGNTTYSPTDMSDLSKQNWYRVISRGRNSYMIDSFPMTSNFMSPMSPVTNQRKSAKSFVDEDTNTDNLLEFIRYNKNQVFV